jgi:drug/metabolite transporter (DMT)-like permease
MSPQGQGELFGYVLVLVSSLAYAVLFISGRLLSATESVVSLVFSFNVCVGLLALVLLPFFWSGMSLNEFWVLVLLALLAFSGHMCMTSAFAKAPASAIVPFEYSALLWAVCFDYWFWQQTPVATTWVGAALIIGSGLYVLHRERLHERLEAGLSA